MWGASATLDRDRPERLDISQTPFSESKFKISDKLNHNVEGLEMLARGPTYDGGASLNGSGNSTAAMHQNGSYNGANSLNGSNGLNGANGLTSNAEESKVPSRQGSFVKRERVEASFKLEKLGGVPSNDGAVKSMSAVFASDEFAVKSFHSKMLESISRAAPACSAPSTHVASLIPTLEVKLPEVSLLDDVPLSLQGYFKFWCNTICHGTLQNQIAGYNDGTYQYIHDIGNLLGATNLSYLRVKNFDMDGGQDVNPILDNHSADIPDVDTSLTEMVLSFSKSMNDVGLFETKPAHPKGKKRRRKDIPIAEDPALPTVAPTLTPPTPTTQIVSADIRKTVESAGAVSNLLSESSSDEFTPDLYQKIVSANRHIEKVLEKQLHAEFLDTFAADDEDVVIRLLGCLESLIKDREFLDPCWNPSTEVQDDDVFGKMSRDLELNIWACDESLMAMMLLICLLKSETVSRKFPGETIILLLLQFLKTRIEDFLLNITNYAHNLCLFRLDLAENFQDQIIVMAYSMALSPFFVEVTTFGNEIGIPKLQRHCIKVVMSIFSKYPAHRQLIMERLLGILCELRLQRKPLDNIEELSLEIDNSPSDPETIALARSNLEASNTCSAYILKYLLSRAFPPNDSGKGEKKGRKSIGVEIEGEFRVTLDGFVKDCLDLVADVEWPAAIMIANVYSQMMRQALEEKSDTGLKLFALDWFGDCIGKIRRVTQTSRDAMAHLNFTPSVSFEELQMELGCSEWNGESSVRKIGIVHEAEDVVLNCLELCDLQEYPIKAASAFFISMWMQRFSALAGSANSAESPWMKELSQCYITIAIIVDVFLHEKGVGMPSLPNQKRSLSLSDGVKPDHNIGRALVYLSSSRSQFFGSSEYFLSLILSALRIDIISVRSRAVRALGDISSADASVLARSQLMNFVNELMCDSSTSVRDSTVQLLGGLLTANISEEVIDRYYPMLLPRILDVGPSVRKRTLKLVKDMYDSEYKIAVSAAGSAACRIIDDEDAVKDLALKCLSGMWLCGLRSGKSFDADIITDETEQIVLREGCFKTLGAGDKQDIILRVYVMMDTVQQIGSASLLEECMGRMVKGQTSKSSKRDSLALMSLLTECVAEQVLLQEENASNPNEDHNLNHHTCNPNNTKLTEPSHNPHNPITPSKEGIDDARIMDDKIVCSAANILMRTVPVAVNLDAALVNRIELDLIGMLSNRSHKVLSAVVPCLCVLVDAVSKNYAKLIRVLKTCYETLRKVLPQVNGSSAPPSNILRNVARSLVISSYILRNFDFDAKLSCFTATDFSVFGPEGKSVAVAVYEIILAYASPKLPLIMSYALQALGHVFSRYPRIMLRDDARCLMDNVFNSGGQNQKIDLIKVFEEFLSSEQSKIETKKTGDESGIDLQVLVGNAEEMGDAGVSSQLMQLYLDRVLGCMLSKDMGISAAAFNVVALILEQGLVHPLNCMPSLVAMQAHPDPMVHERAYEIYETLVSKHDSFIHTRNAECVHRMFTYLQTLHVPVNLFQKTEIVWIPGYNTTAVLDRFYSNIPFKKGRRMEFLMTMVKGVEAGELVFARFLCENLGGLEYKTLEEVLHVMYCVDLSVGVSGEDVYVEVGEVLEKWSLEGVNAFEPETLFSLSTRCSKTAMLFCLKSHLSALYGVPESKCRKYSPTAAKQGDKAKTLQRVMGVSAAIKWDRFGFDPTEVMTEVMSLMGVFEKFKEFMEKDFFVAREGLSDLEGSDGGENGVVPDNDDGGVQNLPVKRRASTGGAKSKPKKAQRRASEVDRRRKSEDGVRGKKRKGVE
ncbi:sister chromatid cohesion C-terminus-domain-containing protein [Chytridium lagenaria]|nr:sister chromatid cohesion C-terminus-domain-containing protein [Chytridium lagenaria]